MKAKIVKKTVSGQPSYQLVSDCVEAYITETGGHLAPVVFDRKKSKIQPYSVSPWACEKVDPATPPILKVLRGDFFCLPFGGNIAAWRGEKHPVHGETANAKWKLESLEKAGRRTSLYLSLRTKVRKGRVDKCISLVDGHNAVYSRHVVSGMSGPMNLGHHATLRFPDEPGSGVLSTSPFKLGQVYVKPTELPEEKGYSILKPGALFKSLDKVPTITGENADLSRYPARRGYEDIVHIISDPKVDIAWTAVTFPKQKFVWFALKDPRVLNGTLMWISNGGRHYAPWNSRHVNVMGLEELTSYFHEGIAASVQRNSHNKRGIPTALKLDPKRPLVVNYIMAVALIPSGFDKVKTIDCREDSVTLVAASGKRVTAPLDVAFLFSQEQDEEDEDCCCCE